MNLKYIIFALSFTTVVAGCNEDKFLDIKPQATLNNGNLSNPKNVDLLINAAYSALMGSPGETASIQNIPMTNWSYGEVRADNAYKGGGGITDVQDIHRLETFDVDATLGNVDSKWFNLYSCVQRCNSALKVLNTCSEDDVPELASRKAEMRVLRAHFYFELSRLFNRIPYFDENVDINDYVNIPNNKYTRDEILGMIADELMDAGSATQYFVGHFDGKVFVNESPTLTKWMDWGKDNYATVTWSNAPAGRCIALGWMSNWQYANNVPTTQYRSTNTIARDLTLYKVDNELYLKSTPSPEIKKARSEKVEIPSFKVTDKYEVASLLKDNKGAYELEMTIENAGASKIALALVNDQNEKVSMYYDTVRKQFVMDRSASGIVDFSRDFPAVTVAPVEDTNKIHLRLFVDSSSIEAFGEEGKFVMTNLVFPTVPYNKLILESDKDGYTVKSLSVYKLQ